ncbi:DUF1801 domain-containing protein [Parvularcula sp. ZS-1/3]|uniref:DUF1801 domain-containing protein n=1 Tax=Parvularcula mediterranea TaxID=2732508 RepID=A0A7Y3W5A1_9PROT|nr:DUF1801 domain-containing protein [Parvularcula mediterranea]NNU16298.1 DUF1801 domain-containing protein [Parvularcula mediterranea]
MMNNAETMLDLLEGRAREIADTVRREVEACAPYAEFGLALGVPTWSLFDRVVSLIPFERKCNLHFWRGSDLDAMLPGRLRGTGAGAIRFIELRSLLDVDAEVKLLLREAFQLQIAHLAEAEAGLEGKVALSR